MGWHENNKRGKKRKKGRNQRGRDSPTMRRSRNCLTPGIESRVPRTGTRRAAARSIGKKSPKRFRKPKASMNSPMIVRLNSRITRNPTAKQMVPRRLSRWKKNVPVGKEGKGKKT